MNSQESVELGVGFPE